ncbi:MAG: tyrosine-protein phosphatase [Planctomycetes bacterium]|nr:tyrosine-protein phosphatase [Planctomycetota bacterium]
MHAPLLRAALALPALALLGCGAVAVVDRAPNGQVVLIRSPQPDAEDLRELHADYGVKTVLNLRGRDHDADWYLEEQIGVREIGATWVHYRVSGRSGPTPHDTQAFLDLVRDPNNWPIVMHCQGGIHRTGAMVGLYRIAIQGWSNGAAIEELEDDWFDWTLEDRSAIKAWLRSYRPDREPDEQSGPRPVDSSGAEETLAPAD